MNIVQQVIDGMTTGSIYAALALALVLVYRSTGMINFAQGQMAVLSTYLAWAMSQTGVPIVLAVVLAVVIAIVMGAVIERLLIRRFEGREHLTMIIVTVGLMTTINGVVIWIWGADLKTIASLFPSDALGLGSARFTVHDVGTVAVLVSVIVVMQVLFQRTRLGLALRAVADNPQSSALSGLPIGVLLMTGWALAGAVGSLGGVLIAPKISLQPGMLDSVLIYAVAAAILGGLDSPIGAVVAAWVLGVVQNLAGTYIPLVGTDLQIAVPLVIMAVVLLIRPQGLFGRREVMRV
ncbi:branched-chain amino acid ABC transporter permease [Nonomuraea antimicrobica]|uniref:Branched-chain amino acid ABC transporter permease n=1 Tax=Nonomuraea antimicrobica TaxID=561173 RepID=A0ABP7BAY0_9ACTN